MPLSLAEEKITVYLEEARDQSSSREEYGAKEHTTTTDVSNRENKNNEGDMPVAADASAPVKGIKQHPLCREGEGNTRLVSVATHAGGQQRKERDTEATTPEEGEGGLACCPYLPQQQEQQQQRVAKGRARIYGLLVERGARRTWRRAPNAQQTTLDHKYAALMKHDDGRNFCTFNG